MKTGTIVLVLVAIIALLVGGMYVSRRNEMVRKNEAVKSAWAQVDVVLQRRADLIVGPSVAALPVEKHGINGNADATRHRTERLNESSRGPRLRRCAECLTMQRRSRRQTRTCCRAPGN